jgi:hypothetical protein
MAQNLFAILLGQMEIKQHNRRGVLRLLCGELVKHLEGVVSIVDDVEGVGEGVGIEHPTDQADIDGVIVHDEDRQWGLRCRRRHDRRSSNALAALSLEGKEALE